MKVKKSTKKVQTTHPEVEQAVQRITACPADKLPDLLRELFPSTSINANNDVTPGFGDGAGQIWRWPRGDLHSWIPVLDKFDEILEKLLGEYNLVDPDAHSTSESKIASQSTSLDILQNVAASPTAARASSLFPVTKQPERITEHVDLTGIQTQEFAPQAKDVILEILKLQRLLLDNSTGRKLFASYDRLSALLFTSDLQVLSTALSVILRPAQQYSFHTPFELTRGEGGKHPALHQRLLSLASGSGDWGVLKERGRDMIVLASEDPSSSKEPSFPRPASHDLQFSFYRPADSTAGPLIQVQALEQPTADLQLKESAGSQTDSPSKLGISRYQALQYSFGLSDKEKNVAGSSTDAEMSTPHAAQATELSPEPVVESESISGLRSSTNSDGYTTITMTSQYIKSAIERGQTPHQVLATVAKQFHIPNSAWFNLLGKLRSAMLLNEQDGSSQQIRREMIICRLMALATYMYLTTEDVAQSELFLYEPTLITQVAALAHPTVFKKVGDRVVAATFVALESCLRYRTKATEVLSAVNANAGHGILMSCFRSLVSRLSTAQDVPHDLVDAVISFLATASAMSGVNNMVVGAGIIPLLIDLTKVENPARASYVARGIGLTDSILYGSTNAFSIFLNAGGVTVMIERIKLETDHIVDMEQNQNALSDTEIYRRTTVLKLLLRSVHRLMQAQGTAEGLRNLVDSSLTKSLDRIFRNYAKVGPAVLSFAINVTATFVHNEPTSLSIIQEMKLHESLYDAIEQNTKPTFDVVASIPTAIGAMCLNQVGLDYTLSRKRVISGLVHSIASKDYREGGMQERDNATYIGSGMDELVRHQPALKPILLESVIELLKRVAQTGKTGHSRGLKSPEHYKLVSPSQAASAFTISDDVAAASSSGEDAVMGDATTEVEENVDVVVDVVAKFLQGVFHNVNLSQEFLRAEGLALVLDLYDMPALVSQFAATEVAMSLNHVVRALAEAEIDYVLAKLVEYTAKIVLAAYPSEEESVLAMGEEYLQMVRLPNPLQLDELNVRYRSLVHINNTVALLSELFCHVGFAHGRVATAFLESLGASKGSRVLSHLGRLHRSSIAANILLKVEKPEDASQKDGQTFEEIPMMEQVVSPLLGTSSSTSDAVSQILETQQGQDAKPVTAPWPKWKQDNYSSVKFLATHMSVNLTPFFTSIIKMLLFRRTDATHKAQSQPTARLLATVILEHMDANIAPSPVYEEEFRKFSAQFIQVYRTSVLGMISLYFLESRPTSGSLQTLLLLQLHRQGGVAKIAEFAADLINDLNEYHEGSTGETPSKVLVDHDARTFGSFKVALDLIKALVSAKIVMDSSQTTLLVQAGRDKPLGDPDYFNAVDFLASLRFTLFDVIRRAWKASWLLCAPLPVARSAVQAMLAVLQGLPQQDSMSNGLSNTETDRLRGVLGLGPAHVPVPAAAPAPFVLNETFVDMLTEMGFTRYAATHALTRLRNNLPAATEYLLTNGHLIQEPPANAAPPPQPAGAPLQAVEGDVQPAAEAQPPPEAEPGAAAVPSEPEAGDTADVDMAIEAPTVPVADEQLEPQEDAKEIKDNLEKLCASERPGVPNWCLQLIDHHDGLVFDVSSVFLEAKDGLQTILDSTKTAKPTAEGADGETCLAARLRLLAVILNGQDSGAKFSSDLRIEFMETLASLPRANSQRHFKWIPAQFLCAQALFRIADDIVKLTSGEAVPESIFVGPTFDRAREAFYDSAISILRSADISSEELSAALRLLVVLTRNRSLAARLLEGGVLQLLFDVLQKAPSKESGAFLGFVNMIIRHIVEDEATLKDCVQREIRSWFNKPRSKVVDVSHFVSNIRPVALRDPEMFLRVVEDECALVTPDPRGGGPFHIQAKEDSPDSASKAEATATGLPPTVDDPFKVSFVTQGGNATNRDRLVQHLSDELHALASTAETIADSPTTDIELQTRGDMRRIAENVPQYHRACALLLSLTELVGSYVGCKTAFIVQSGKHQSKDVAPLQQGKSRTTMVHFLLNNFVCNLSYDVDICRSDSRSLTHSQKRWISLQNWASTVIVALCADSGSGGTLKDIPLDLVSVRKLVLETIVKAIKDILSSADNINIRYGRLYALSQLTYRLLTAKATVQSKHHDDTTVHLAKIMLEKGFVTTLTNTLMEVDLNYPNVKVLVATILQPLEFLTKVSTKMGRAEKNKSAGRDQMSEDDMSTDGETDEDQEDDEDMAGPDDEEGAPDLYRNSALGMFGGEMDEYMEGEEDDEDADLDEDGEHYDDDEDMDDDSEGTEPSSDSEIEEWDDVDDDDESMNDEGEDDAHQHEFIIENGAEDINGDEDEVFEGDMDGDMSEMGDIDEEGIFDDEEDDEEGDPGMDDDEGSEIFEEIYEEVESFNDARAGTGGSNNASNLASWGWSQPIPRDTLDVNSRYRRRPNGHRLLDEEANFAMFGRSRNTSSTSAVNITEHPLLQREPEPEPQLRGPASRRSARGPSGPMAGSLGDILQSLTRIMGTQPGGGPVGDAMMLLDRTLPDGQGGGAIRIDIHGGAGTGPVDIHVDSRPSAAAPSSNLSDSVPQPTMNRWSEEEKIVSGSSSVTRIANLATLVINTLLPEAKRRQEADRKKQADEQIASQVKAQAEAKEQAKKDAEAVEQAKKVEEEEAATRERDAQQASAEAAETTLEPEGNTVGMDVDEAVPAPQEFTTPVVTTEDSPAAEPEPPARVTILIHGAEVDITETGIDPEFLEALPDDMRADVVNQHLRAREPEQPRMEQVASSSISPEFLDALPPEIRAEVIQQEAIEAARRAQRDNAAAAANAGDATRAAAPSADAGGFLAGMHPSLRDVVMMEPDNDFLAALGLDPIRRGGRERFPGEPSRHPPAADHATSVTRDAIQLLDKNGIASLVRLLFFPDLSRRNYLLKVLANLCENARSRAELINLLLGVLVDGTGDVALAADAKPSKIRMLAAAATPKGTPRRKNFPETPSVPISNMFGHLQSDNIPAFVAQRCFEGLSHIIAANEQASIYFLTENESPSMVSTPANLRKSTSKKGKAKERERGPSYPLVALLGLLDRHTLLVVPNMMESLTSLLATITKPLLSLKTKDAASENAITSGAESSAAEPPNPEGGAQVAEGTASMPAVTAAAVGTGLTRPPIIPADALRLVARILTAGECTSRTFSYTLQVIQNLTMVPEARDVISTELRYQAQSLADQLTVDLKELSRDLPAMGDRVDSSGVSLTKFAASTSLQAKLLRIFKAIDYMYTAGSTVGGSNGGGLDVVAMAASEEARTVTLTVDEQRASEIYSSLHLTPCWQALGECLDLVNANANLLNIATILLPLVESLMVVCKYASAKAAVARTQRASSSPMSPTSPMETSSEDLFMQFTNSHKQILNVMVRNNPSLMSGSFSLLVLNPRILEFDNKRSWFSQQLRKKTNRDIGGVISFAVRRQYVFDDSYTKLQQRSGEELKHAKLSVKFIGEEGVDAGGVTREWYTMLAQSIFNPGYCLFEPCAADQQTYQPSQRSWVNGDHLGYFRFIGKMIGKAIFDGRLLDAYFSRAFYKQILGRKVDLRDLESVDPEYHKSLVWMLENDITGIIDLDFSLEVEEFGTKKVIELKEGGANITVTEDNKEEYVRLVVQYRLDAAIKEQINAFLGGFYDIIPRKLISIFDPDQLELLISGISVIDVDELKNSAQLHGWKDTDPEITWFWRALRSFSQEERARFLMFATSSSRVPLQGFAHLQGSSGVQPFQIHKLHREDVLPSSATCFNELLLPTYPSYEALRARLLTAITEGSQGFGLA